LDLKLLRRVPAIATVDEAIGSRDFERARVALRLAVARNARLTAKPGGGAATGDGRIATVVQLKEDVVAGLGGGAARSVEARARDAIASDTVARSKGLADANSKEENDDEHLLGTLV